MTTKSGEITENIKKKRKRIKKKKNMVAVAGIGCHGHLPS